MNPPRSRRREEADPAHGRAATDWVPALECGDLSPHSKTRRRGAGQFPVAGRTHLAAARHEPPPPHVGGYGASAPPPQL